MKFFLLILDKHTIADSPKEFVKPLARGKKFLKKNFLGLEQIRLSAEIVLPKSQKEKIYSLDKLIFVL